MKKIFNSIFALFSEDGSRCSLGRISFWISFGIAMHIWINKPYNEFPESLLWFLFFGYVYNTSKKLLNIILPAFLAKKIPGLRSEGNLSSEDTLRFKDDNNRYRSNNISTDTAPVYEEEVNEPLKKVER